VLGVEFLLTTVFGYRARASSLYSGISPGTSRKVSMEEEYPKSDLGQAVETREYTTREGTTTG
jgi:hypothetical protein